MRIILAGFMALMSSAWAYDPATWLDQLSLVAPEAYGGGVAAHGEAALPDFTVAGEAGRQLVRASLPFPPGALADGLGLAAKARGEAIPCDVRVLTVHPGKPRWVRRAIVTFPYTFPADGAVAFKLERTDKPPTVPTRSDLSVGPVSVALRPDGVTLAWDGGAPREATIVAPPLAGGNVTKLEIIERGQHFLWVRLLVADEAWPRIVEVKADSLGGVAVQAHIQRRGEGDAYAPTMGWRIESTENYGVSGVHPFDSGENLVLVGSVSNRRLHFPVAPLTRKGGVTMNGGVVDYVRCLEEDTVPMQSMAWRRMAFVFDPPKGALRDALLEPALDIKADAEAYDALYASGVDTDLAPWPPLVALRAYTRDAIVQSALFGDDYGNVTSYNPGGPAPTFGMNRLNHCPAIFEEAYRSGDARLVDTAVLWCANMYDQSIWWGEGDDFGGTRYNNAVAAGQNEHDGDNAYMWRTNYGRSTFCTKGYDSFFYAYEETGDPRMAVALRHQVAFASKSVHANTGEARNIGDAVDFARLYQFTGLPKYRDEAMRLFREVREKMGKDGLFSQGGQPIEDDRPFIDDDAMGTKHPFAKPYIIGYALAGCPSILDWAPDERRLEEMISAVSTFLASTVDPAGGWRYPAPESSGLIISQGIEHAAQLTRAAKALQARGHDVGPVLDAIETVLQARVQGYAKSGQILSGLSGWERATGALGAGETLHDRYARPDDRDHARDYTEGGVGIGGSSPEGLVYLTEVLDYYLSQRPADRLWNTTPELAQVLARVEQRMPAPAKPTVQTERFGVKDYLPVFSRKMTERLNFPMAFQNSGMEFGAWRTAARAALLESLGSPPPRAAFAPVVLGEENRRTHRAYKIAFNINGWERVKGYLLVPKGEGPFPAVLALHDHGAHFTIGKEKIVRPFNEPKERLDDAQAWVAENYGGRWFGDELAARGYVVFATDMLYWGDRARSPEVAYDDQQALGANMLQLGGTWAGHILWDDLRSAEFLQSRAEVDPERIGAMGLSIGSFRTWNLAAATDIVKAGAAICWMSDTASLLGTGNNQTSGQSAFTTIQPFIRNSMDYPDVASIACPKPMLFYNGSEDPLFPLNGVARAHGVLRNVWASQRVRDRLVTKVWPVPHQFNIEMQEEAFKFMDTWLKE